MAYLKQFHEHVWSLIPEDAEYKRNLILEQAAMAEGQFGGVKYLYATTRQQRFETYNYEVFRHLAVCHPTTAVALQGSNVVDVSNIDQVNYERKIQIAIQHFRFVSANRVVCNGEDKFAGTYKDNMGNSRVAITSIKQLSGEVLYADPKLGTLKLEPESVKEGVIDTELKNKYGEWETYISLANGTPIGTVIPMNDQDIARRVPVWVAAAGDVPGHFEGKTFPEAFATSIAYRTIVPSQQIIGMAQLHIPIDDYFSDILDHRQNPIANVALFTHYTVPVFTGGLPFILGKIDDANGHLISAGDVLPGGIIYEHLAMDRSYPYIPMIYSNEATKYPTNGTEICVGPRGEMLIGTNSYVPFYTNGNGYWNKAGTAFTPAGVPAAVAARNHTVFAPAITSIHDLIVTNVSTGVCGKSQIATITNGNITVNAGAAMTAVTDGVVSATAVLSSATVVGQIDNVIPATRNLLAALSDTAINAVQGYPRTINTMGREVYRAYANAGRVVTVTKDGVRYQIDFSKGTQIDLDTAGAIATNYTVEHFVVDAVNHGLLGTVMYRFDVFQAKLVAK